MNQYQNNQNYNQNYNQNGGQGGQQQNQNSGFDNHAKIQVIGRITKDPESKMVNSSKVASSSIAINHRGQNNEADFWFIEAWGNENADSRYNFLVNHCPKGRKVFIEGTPMLKKNKDQQGNYTYFPTIRVTDIIGLEGGNNQNQNNASNQQQPPNGQFNQNQNPGGFQQQPPQVPQGGYGQPVPQGAPQGGFPPNPPGGGYGQPQPPQGAAVGAPNNGGFPPVPPQQ